MHRSAGVPDNIIQEATLASEQRRAIEHLKASPLPLKKRYHSSGAERYDHSIAYPSNPPNNGRGGSWETVVGRLKM